MQVKDLVNAQSEFAENKIRFTVNGKKLTIKNYNDLVNLNVISWEITDGIMNILTEY